jgi:hypothetical protein
MIRKQGRGGFFTVSRQPSPRQAVSPNRRYRKLPPVDNYLLSTWPSLFLTCHTFWWCPSIAWMKRRQCKAGRLLIVSADDSQRSLGKKNGVELTGSYGTPMSALARATSTFWPGRHRELPSTKARLAMVYFGFATPTANDAFPVALQTYLSPWWTIAEEQRAGLCNGPDARQSCICCHPRYRGTPPKIASLECRTPSQLYMRQPSRKTTTPRSFFRDPMAWRNVP